MTSVVEDPAGQDCRLGVAPNLSRDALLSHPVLHHVEEFTVDDGLVLALVDLAPVDLVADVEPVLEEMR